MEYHPKFRLIMHTKYFNPHYKPEMQAQCSLINFLVTRDGLEDQLLAAVVAKERPDLEQLKVPSSDVSHGWRGAGGGGEGRREVPWRSAPRSELYRVRQREHSCPPPSRPQNVIVTQRTASRRDQEPQRCPRALEPPAAAGTSSQGAQGRPGPHAAPRHMVGSDRQLQRPGQGHCPARFQPSCAPGPGQAVGRPRRRGRWRAVPATTRPVSAYPPQANLTKSQNEFKIVLKELEDSLLARLSAASGNFLGDTALVENLETTKHTASEIEEKVSSPPPPRRVARKGRGGPRHPGGLPRAPGTAPRGPRVLRGAVRPRVLPTPLACVSRYKRQKSQRSKSTRRERTTGPRRSGPPCSTSY